MYPSGVVQPLSPPSSPRMSGQDQKPVEPIWNAQQSHQTSYIPVGSRSQASNVLSYPPSLYGSREGSQQGTTLPNFQDVYGNLGNPSPTTTASQTQSTGGNDLDFSRKNTDSSAESLSSLQHRDSVVGPSGGSQQSGMTQRFDDSDIQEGDEDIGSDGEDEPKQEGEEDRQLTAAEIRQQKRKMKRFRLTHSQTRYLMSEFARQAHPDAAHRERLSREIPGLSPRQVQVWFQNRRAKLKRLSAEDRERMMRSRALPDNYGMGMPMNPSPYMPSPSTAGSTTPGLPQNPGLGRIGDMRPLTLDTLRRGPEHSYTSPTSVTPALGSLAFTPPQSATDTQSPISTTGDMGAFGYSHRSVMESPRRPILPPGHSSAPSYSANFPSSVGRMPSYDRLRTSSGDSLGSPLRTSMSYSNFQTASSMSQGQDRREGTTPTTSQAGSHSRGNSQREMPPPSGPFGLGFSFDSMPNYQSNVQGQSQPASTAGQAQTGYRGVAPSSNNQTSYPSYFDYNNSNYSTPQLPHYQSSFGGSYSSPLSSNPFGQNTGASHQVMAPMQGHSQGYAQQSHGGPMKREAGDEDHTDGGVPLSNAY